MVRAANRVGDSSTVATISGMIGGAYYILNGDLLKFIRLLISGIIMN